MQTKVKTDKEIEYMRKSGEILRTVLDEVIAWVEPGNNLVEVDQYARKIIKKFPKAKAAFYGYYGFPGVLCLSVNDEVVHGTPRGIELSEGDILSLDFGINYKGMITDSARTFAIGDIDSKTQKLMAETKRSLDAGIDQIKDGVKVGEISFAIEEVLNSSGLGIIRELVGHGVGHELHEEPNIPNYGSKGTGPMLKSGMTIAVEPMATLGGEDVTVDKDKWTVRTADKSLSAHFEHTILITDSGYEILT